MNKAYIGPLRMRISFDLDEVLFVDPGNHKTEKILPFPFNRIFKERLRLGTPELIKGLQKEGYEVWVYTSSFRTARYIKNYFRCYGVRFDGIVNGQRHQAEVQRGHKDTMPTKLPNRYQISLHVDDESIVATYGKSFGFEVYQLDAQDDDWKEKIIARADQVKKMKQAQNLLPKDI